MLLQTALRLLETIFDEFFAERGRKMFAENLKKFRKLSGFRQDDVAKVIGLDRSAYAYYESGKTEPSIENIKKIAKMFGIDVNTLLGFDVPIPEIVVRTSEENPYSVADSLYEDDIGKCTSEERYLIACYRACENKKDIIQAVNKIYESEILG